MNRKVSISIIGAGNGGQAFAGHLGALGYPICLYNRNLKKIQRVIDQKGIYLSGKVQGYGEVHHITDNLEEAVKSSPIILITTTADAHRQLAEQMSQYLSEGQIIILSPGRTFGALDFYQGLKDTGFDKKVYIGEAQTLVYACRTINSGMVNIIGMKDKVLFATFPKEDVNYVLSRISPIFPSFVAAQNILETGLENIGAVFHPSIVLFNAAVIERGHEFYFYRDITPKIAEFIIKLDQERLNVGKAYGLDLISAEEWVSYAYNGITGNTLCEKMVNNPAYFDIMSPRKLTSRQLAEDIPTGVLPIVELGRLAGVDVKLFESLLNITEGLLNVDFTANGRTLKRLGLLGLDKHSILKQI